MMKEVALFRSQSEPRKIVVAKLLFIVDQLAARGPGYTGSLRDLAVKCCLMSAYYYHLELRGVCAVTVFFQHMLV